MSPARIGVTSPAITATIASSSSATPSAMRPRRISARPRPWQANDARSRSPNRRAISAAWLNAAWPAAGRPARCVEWRKESADTRARRSRAAPRRGCVRLWRTSPAAGAMAPRCEESKRQPECRSSGPFDVASIEEGLMRARADGLALVIPAHEVGRRREPFEVFGFERYVAVGGFQQPIRLGPRPLFKRLPSAPQSREVRHVNR